MHHSRQGEDLRCGKWMGSFLHKAWKLKRNAPKGSSEALFIFLYNDSTVM